MQSNIACPKCRKASVVPSGEVKQLPHNFFIQSLLDDIVLKHRIEGEEEAKCDHCTSNAMIRLRLSVKIVVNFYAIIALSTTSTVRNIKTTI